MRVIALLFLVFLLHHGFRGNSQNLPLRFSDSNKQVKCKKYFTNPKDSIDISKTIRYCLLKLYSDGYIEARVDTLVDLDKNPVALGFAGNRYKWKTVGSDSLTRIILRDAGISFRFNNKPVSPKNITRFNNSVLKYLENNGYPFAQIRFDDVVIQDGTVSANLAIAKGRKVFIDTLYLKGELALNNRVLQSVSGLKKGALYSEQKFRLLDKRIRQLPFAGLIKSSEVEFIPGKARIYLYLSKRNASHFSGIAGFYNDETTGKIKFNGNINLKLANQLHRAEVIEFEWLSPASGTQKLNIATTWPSIFGWQAGMSGSFILFRQDSTYLNINPRISLDIRTFSGDIFNIFADYRNSKISAINPNPDLNKFSILLYGLGYQVNSLDNQFLPSSGGLVKLTSSAGSKTKTRSKRAAMMEGCSDLVYYKPIINQRLVISLQSRTKILYQTQNEEFSVNELYRIGGLGTLRGFNQESVFTSFYSVLSTEVHLRFSSASGVYLFTEKGFVKAYKTSEITNAWPLSFGFGLNLTTVSGLFQLVYATGKGFGQSFGLKDAKVHVGYIALF